MVVLSTVAMTTKMKEHNLVKFYRQAPAVEYQKANGGVLIQMDTLKKDKTL